MPAKVSSFLWVAMLQGFFQFFWVAMLHDFVRSSGL
jgi:hypothetical protein